MPKRKSKLPGSADLPEEKAARRNKGANAVDVALERLSKLSPEEQAAALLNALVASSDKKKR